MASGRQINERSSERDETKHRRAPKRKERKMKKGRERGSVEKRKGEKGNGREGESGRGDEGKGGDRASLTSSSLTRSARAVFGRGERMEGRGRRACEGFLSERARLDPERPDKGEKGIRKSVISVRTVTF